MLVLLDDRSVMGRFARRLLHKKVYRISDFLVRLNHDVNQTKYHVVLGHNSVVDHFDADMPDHSWDLITVPHVLNGIATGGGLVGKCTFLFFVCKVYY